MACFLDFILGEQQFINAKYPRPTSNPIKAMKNVISLNLQMKDKQYTNENNYIHSNEKQKHVYKFKYLFR